MLVLTLFFQLQYQYVLIYFHITTTLNTKALTYPSSIIP